MSNVNSIDLTIYLIRNDRESPTAILVASGLRRYPVAFSPENQGELFVKATRPKVPDWARFFSGQVDLRDIGRSTSPAAVLLLSVDGRWFVIAFGASGRFLIDQGAIEDRFGLVTVLNSIPEDRIRSLDKTAFDARGTHSRVQTSREASAVDFGLDIENDLVTAVTGRPPDSEADLGLRLSGMDALRATARLALEDLPQQLSRYLTKYRSNTYRKTFPWVDHIAAVKDAGLTDVLDSRLVSALRDEDVQSCWLAVPGVVDWGSYNRFRYGGRPGNPLHHDLDLSAWLAELDQISSGKVGRVNLDAATLRRATVRCVDENAGERYAWTIYKCLSAEISLDQKTYVLSGGQWYRVHADIVDQVNEFYESLDRYEAELPEYNDESETAYNARVVAESEGHLALLDADLIPYGGVRQKIEVCDLYTSTREFIHVKRYSQSSALSHLFSQGTVSGELFRSQADFRELVNAKLPASHRIADCQPPPDSNQYRVVYAVVSKEPGDNLTLPFFSRLNLRSATRRLRAYGYRVALAKIRVNAERNVTKKYVSR